MEIQRRIIKKLWPRVEGGGGGGCPVLTFAITPKLFVDDGFEALQAAQAAKAARDSVRKKKKPETLEVPPEGEG